MKTLASLTLTLTLLLAASPAHAMSVTWPDWIDWPSWLGGMTEHTPSPAFQLDDYGPEAKAPAYNFWKHYIDVMYGKEDSTDDYLPMPSHSMPRSTRTAKDSDLPITMPNLPSEWPAWIDEPGWM